MSGTLPGYAGFGSSQALPHTEYTMTIFRLGAALAVLALGACGAPADDPAARDTGSPADGPAATSSDSPEAVAFDPGPWVERGRAIQDTTFATLRGKLAAAMQAGGPLEALDVCNTAAYALTDSLSALYEVDIRRATLRPRNPGNRARDDEAEVIARWAAALDAGEGIGPVVHEVDASTVAYYGPIRVMEPCLACHGVEGTNVSTETLAKLAELYPDDEARGYGAGDLRGAWSLRFSR